MIAHTPAARWPHPFPKPAVAEFGLPGSLDCERSYGFTLGAGLPTDLPLPVFRRLCRGGRWLPAWLLPGDVHYPSPEAAEAALDATVTSATAPSRSR